MKKMEPLPSKSKIYYSYEYMYGDPSLDNSNLDLNYFLSQINIPLDFIENKKDI